MSIATTSRREPNMSIFSMVLAGPLVLAFIILMILIFNDSFQHSGINAKTIIFSPGLAA